jgi:membrane protein involved in colicin uptake
MQDEAQRQAQLAQYNDELARKRQQAEHELQRQRNGELVALQEQAAARKEAERLRIEQQIQAERRSADQHAVRQGAGWQIHGVHDVAIVATVYAEATTAAAVLGQ